MKLKLEQKHQEFEAGSIIDCDEITAKELIESKKAIEYVETEATKIETKAQIEQMVEKELNKEDKNMSDTEKKGVIEVTKNAYSETQGWKNLPEYMVAVKAFERGKYDPRLEVKAATGLGEGSSGIGEALLTPQFVSDQIYRQMIDAAVVAPKCQPFQLSEYAHSTIVKQINASTLSSTSAFGGLRVYKVDEGSSITPSKPTFTSTTVTPSKAAVVTYISDELIQDCPNAVSNAIDMVGQSFGYQIDNDIVNGGLSIATQVVGNGATVAITVAGNNPTAAEWASMYTAMAPQWRTDQAEWFVGNNIYAGLMNLATPITTSGAGYPIFTRDATEPQKYLLYGHKVNVVPWAAAAGSAGSILFANFSNYAYVTKGGINSAMSIHVAFLTAENVYRWYIRYGGCPLVYSKVQLPNSQYLGAFVTRS